MIDLHCHILPGIDDGAKELDDSLALINAAISNGITHMLCTPHIQLGRFDNTLDTILTAFELVQQQVIAQALKIHLAFAAEVRLCPEIMILAKQAKLPFIGKWQGKHVLLLELPHSHIPPGTEQLIKWLHKNDIIPMIAHPERNRDILADYSKLKMLIRMDCLFQLTASSVVGDFGEGPQQVAEKMLSDDLVNIIATDAHNLKRRPPKLAEGKMAAVKIVGEEKAQQLVYDTPWLISASKFM
ncbi:MAG: capsular biosynthesis protein [Alteromonadaceae bacterium]|nr:capsular biosynthesis protein [Alteromonadaceae bacterium]